MRRSARQPEPDLHEGFGDVLREGLAVSVATIGRNPVAIGGTTAFLVAFFYVSANALWYQPHFHAGAFFATRPVSATTSFPGASGVTDDGASRIVIEREDAQAKLDNGVGDAVAAATAQGHGTPAPLDPTVGKVQELLAGLELYDGPVDGIAGPQTARAVQAYQRIIGLETTGAIDATLLEQLGATAHRTTTGANTDGTQLASLPEAPRSVPAPQPRPDITASITQPQRDVPVADPRVLRIQAGLKAFGNDGIDLDGIVGPKTSAAIREFQALFGLPETGQPDAAVAAKMREIGLTD